MERRLWLIIILLPGIASALCPDPMPEGMLFCDDFEDGSLDGWTSQLVEASDEERNTGQFSAKAVHSGTVIFRRYFPNQSAIYAEWWLFTSSSWDDIHFHNGVKWARLNYHQPSGTNIWWNDESWGSQWSSYDYSETLGALESGAYKRTKYFSGKLPVKGGWMKLAIYAKSNTPGNDDGVFRIWKDGGLEYSSDAFHWASGEAIFRSLDVISNIGDADPGCYNYIDDVVIWRGLPNCTPSCVGKDCDDDGCGGSCGSCQSQYVCHSGLCCHKSDTDLDGCVEDPELISFISRWKASSTDASMMELLEAIKTWKEGCG